VTKEYQCCGKEDDNEEPTLGNQEERGKRPRVESLEDECMEGGSSNVSNSDIMDMF
jgi:hypothetical protein